jgi:2-phospho-L-lactate/phosphoenolpyruvate guanylyltransferase
VASRILTAVHLAVLVPVKRFQLAKRRLAGLLDDTHRVALAQWLAGRVVAAAGALPLFVACDDEAVASWADAAGAEVLWTPGLGLNGAVESSRATISGKGFDHLVIAHSDLPLAGDLGDVAVAHTITLVPDRAGNGTNVLSLPVQAAIGISYGAGSFSAHLSQALTLAGDPTRGLRVEVRRDPRLALDIDTPNDLAHPALRTELPGWLRTILANRR